MNSQFFYFCLSSTRFPRAITFHTKKGEDAGDFAKTEDSNQARRPALVTFIEGASFELIAN
jgi:hypothetical protein